LFCLLNGVNAIRRFTDFKAFGLKEKTNDRPNDPMETPR
jgi:hypothetical protein